MASKYVDTTAIMQVIGCVYNNPSILDVTDKYSLVDEDFPDVFHKTVFGAIFKIHELGAGAVTLTNISDFLASRPKSDAIYKQQLYAFQDHMLYILHCSLLFQADLLSDISLTAMAIYSLRMYILILN